MVSGASGAARSQKAPQWKGPNTIGTRERAWQKRRKTGRDRQRRTRRSVSTLGGAASDSIIGRAAADRAGARPYHWINLIPYVDAHGQSPDGKTAALRLSDSPQSWKVSTKTKK